MKKCKTKLWGGSAFGLERAEGGGGDPDGGGSLRAHPAHPRQRYMAIYYGKLCGNLLDLMVTRKTIQCK